MQLFRSERLSVRPFEWTDSNNFFRLNGDEKIMRYIRPVKDRQGSDDLLRETINYYSSGGNFGAWAIEELLNKKFVGLIMLKPGSLEQASTEIGYALLEEYWGRGLASEIMQASIDFAREKEQTRIFFARTDPSNFASKKLLERNGFVYERSLQPDNQHSDIYFLRIKGDDELF